MPLYAIFRAKKVKTIRQARGRLSHNLRANEVPNANPEIQNEHVFGSKNLEEAVQTLKDMLPKNKKRNAVVAGELFIGASPEFFKKPGCDRAGWVEASMNFVFEKYGKQNIVSAVLHLDEKTPHLQVIFCPMTLEKNPRLCAKEVFGNQDDYVARQTSYARRVKRFGLARGKMGSKATHQTLKQYYAKVNALADDVPQPTLAQRNIAALMPGADRDQVQKFDGRVDIWRAHAHKAKEERRARLVAEEAALEAQNRAERAQGELRAFRDAADNLGLQHELSVEAQKIKVGGKDWRQRFRDKAEAKKISSVQATPALEKDPLPSPALKNYPRPKGP
jgi:hypothetical protein